MQGKNNRGKTHNYRLNRQIPGREVRIVSEQGSLVITKEAALAKCKEAGVDLIEIAPARENNGQSIPAVCRLEQIGRFLYKKEKEKANLPKKQKEKGISLHINIADHDLETKMRAVEHFLKDKNTVIFKLTFRGREKAHKDLGALLLTRIQQRLTNHGFPIGQSSNDGCMLLRMAPGKPTPKLTKPTGGFHPVSQLNGQSNNQLNGR